MKEIAVVLVVEGKDEWEGGGPVNDSDITGDAVVAGIKDELADRTKHDYALPFMVREVRF